MFSKILVCSDGSKSALLGAYHASEIARKYNAKLLLLNVFDEDHAIKPFFNLWEQNIGRDTLARYIEQKQTDIEQRTQKVFEKTGMQWQTVRENGHAVESIIAVAAAEEVDLIVMGSRGLSGWKSLLLGSISHGVLYHASCSVLIARSEALKFQKILLASDGSEIAHKATVEAVTLAKAFASSLTVLNVCASLTDFAAVSNESIQDVENSVRVREALGHSATSGAAKSPLVFTVRREIGRPAKTILTFAE